MVFCLFFLWIPGRLAPVLPIPVRIGNFLQTNIKCGMVVPAALHADEAVMLLHDFPADGEPQAGATLLPGLELVHPVEGLEDPLLLFGGEAFSLIADEEPYIAFTPGSA